MLKKSLLILSSCLHRPHWMGLSLALFSLSAQAGNVSKSLTDLFPGSTADLSTFNNSASLTGAANYKDLMNQCRGYGNPAACEGKTAFGIVNTTGAPDSHRGMNRMIILSPTGNRRFEAVEISGGQLQYDSAKVRENEIGFINVAYFRGAQATPFHRCDAEVVVCGANVVGCPQASPQPVCAPVMANNTLVNQNCTCPTGTFLQACIGNVPDCQPMPAPSPGPSCAVDEVQDDGRCKKKWTCDAGNLFSSEANALADQCTGTTVTLSRDPLIYYPETIYCSGTKTCSKCAPGTYKSGEQCIPCDAGSYSSFEDSPMCTACPTGTIASQRGMSACQACPSGQVATNGTSCQACAAGKYAVGTACVDCPIPVVPGASTISVTSSAGASSPDQCSYEVTSCVAGYGISADRKSCTQQTSTRMLVYGKHSAEDCTAAGGAVAYGPTGESEAMCRFKLTIDPNRRRTDGSMFTHYWYENNVTITPKDEYCPSGWKLYNNWGSWSYKRADMRKDPLGSGAECAQVIHANDSKCSQDAEDLVNGRGGYSPGSGKFTRMTKDQFIKLYHRGPDGVTRLSTHNWNTYKSEYWRYLPELEALDDWYSADSTPSYMPDSDPVYVAFPFESYEPTFQNGVPLAHKDHVDGKREHNWFTWKAPSADQISWYSQAIRDRPECKRCTTTSSYDYCATCPSPPSGSCVLHQNSWREGETMANHYGCTPVMVEAGCY